MVAGSVPILAPVKYTALSYVIPILGTMAITFFIQADELGMTLGFMMLIYLLGMISTINHVHRFIINALRLRRENKALLAQTMELNQTLETRVQARTSQLEHLAHYDPLTQLPNSRLLRDRLEQAITQVRQQQE